MKKVTKKAKSNNFVVYNGTDGEVLITTEALEKKMLKTWLFASGADGPNDEAERFLEDYDRYIVSEVAVEISLGNMRIENGSISYYRGDVIDVS